MAPLTSKKRNALPDSTFAGPDRSYPINDSNHAKNALARVSEFGTSELKARVRAKVKKKYPSISIEGEGTKQRTDRPRRADGGEVGVKGNKGGLTKDQERYGDYAQPKHANGWEYTEQRGEPAQGKYPPVGVDTGESTQEKDNWSTTPERKCGGRAKK